MDDEHLERIEAAFASFMREYVPWAVEHSADWLAVKLGFIAGLSTGSVLGNADEEQLTGKLVSLFERTSEARDLAKLYEKVPQEHRVVLPNGERGVSEVGFIHLATRLEEEDPARAEYLRRARYIIQQEFQRRRAEG